MQLVGQRAERGLRRRGVVLHHLTPQRVACARAVQTLCDRLGVARGRQAGEGLCVAIQRQPDIGGGVVQRRGKEREVGLHGGKCTAHATGCGEDRVTAGGQPVTAFDQRQRAVIDRRATAGDDAVGFATGVRLDLIDRTLSQVDVTVDVQLPDRITRRDHAALSDVDAAHGAVATQRCALLHADDGVAEATIHCQATGLHGRRAGQAAVAGQVQ